MGWEASFVGTQFLAISTSLPEFAASYAAVRIGAPDLAIANLLGSNLFNMGFVLFIDDVAYVDGPLWTGIAQDSPADGGICGRDDGRRTGRAVRAQARTQRGTIHVGVAGVDRVVRGCQRAGVLVGVATLLTYYGAG